MERYYERRAIKNGSIRYCEKCKTKLSRYNYGSMCSTCEEEKSNKTRKDIMGMLRGYK